MNKHRQQRRAQLDHRKSRKAQFAGSKVEPRGKHVRRRAAIRALLRQLAKDTSRAMREERS
jgi:hypothetical protein